ncbi:hypothetical protein [Flavobacterium cerinum]|uniref:Phage late control D family protein n=1 Tax=Flavobacterium cerinum TaxID=2502784 RepID=A0A444HBQ2_9FLAO|nr:hypothetical protein [Flavobacterium cerinum]RWX00911.1 hypothetical protein EPI11_07775 [Flavobacterium cerinum]
MYFDMDWEIFFYTDGVERRLLTLAECEIDCSVDNLADVATIVLPEAFMNEVILKDIESKIGRGSEVIIRLGYDGNLETEFTGYVQDIRTNDSTLKILCEDALYLFRKTVKDVVMKPTSIKKIAQSLVSQIDASFTVSCDYDINYEKFTIHQATAYDVLKKLQEETKANIYFDTAKKVLHIHPPYIEKGGETKYNLHLNVEQSSLEYKRAVDKKIEITVESTDLNGKVTSVTTGATGGDKTTLKVGPMSKADMLKIAESALKKNSFDGYAGSFDTWLIPVVRPTYTAEIEDYDYEYKTGRYYVVSVKTAFSPSGGIRTVTPGIKLS